MSSIRRWRRRSDRSIGTEHGQRISASHGACRRGNKGVSAKARGNPRHHPNQQKGGILVEAGTGRSGWALTWSDGIVRLSASSWSRTSVMETINPISEEEFRKRCVFMPQADFMNFMECADGAWRQTIKLRKYKVTRRGNRADKCARKGGVTQ